MNLTLFLTLAVMIEGITDYIKELLKGKIKSEIPAVVITVIIGVLICLAGRADIFSLFGIELYEPVGAVLTGILLSRGSNYVHSLFDAFKAQKNN